MPLLTSREVLESVPLGQVLEVRSVGQANRLSAETLDTGISEFVGDELPKVVCHAGVHSRVGHVLQELFRSDTGKGILDNASLTGIANLRLVALEVQRRVGLA